MSQRLTYRMRSVLKDLYARLASSEPTGFMSFWMPASAAAGGKNGLLATRTIKVKPIGDIVENIVAFGHQRRRGLVAD